MVESKSQSPFFLKTGDIEIWCLFDGFFSLGAEVLFGQESPGCLAELDLSSKLTLPINAYLVHFADHWALVDTGNGSSEQFPTGHLMDQLKQTGAPLEKITHVLLTHLHADHIGGLLDSEFQKLLSHAQVCVAKKELDYWQDEENRNKASDLLKPMFDRTNQLFSQLGSHITGIDGAWKDLAGCRLIEAPGHTPGHSVYAFSVGDKSVLLTGDLVHLPQVQFPHLDEPEAIDVDPGRGILARTGLFVAACKKQILIGGGHFPYPGLGYVKMSNAKLEWVQAK